MEINTNVQTFSLLGGPLHRLGCRLKLVRGNSSTVLLGLAMGLFLWLVMVVLALGEGVSEKLFALFSLSGHVRLLLVIPLFFVCDTIFAPRCEEFVRLIEHSKVVPQHQLVALDALVARLNRWKESWVPDAACMVLVVPLSISASMLNLVGASAMPDPTISFYDMPYAAQWYWLVCMPIFRFLLLRWLLSICVWSFFLWRLSRLQLRLIPSHPDGSAGLGYLAVVHTHFLPLIVALSALHAGMLAQELASGRVVFEAIYPAIMITLILDAILFIGPLCVFYPKLWACKIKGMSDYMDLASEYVTGFEEKWVRRSPHYVAPVSEKSESLVGTADLQSLADLGNSVDVVRQMALVPISQRLLMFLILGAVIPFLPLLLFKYPASEMAEKMLSGILGL